MMDTKLELATPEQERLLRGIARFLVQAYSELAQEFTEHTLLAYMQRELSAPHNSSAIVPHKRLANDVLPALLGNFCSMQPSMLIVSEECLQQALQIMTDKNYLSRVNDKVEVPQIAASAAGGVNPSNGKVDLKELARSIAIEFGEPADKIDHFIKTCIKIGSVENVMQLKNESVEDSKKPGNKRSRAGLFYQKVKQLATLHKSNSLPPASESVIVPYKYQLEACKSVGNRNALVVLGTGMGKTLISKLVCDANRERVGNDRFACLFVCQDRELCTQQCRSYVETSNFSVAYCKGGDCFHAWNPALKMFQPTGVKFTVEMWPRVFAMYDVVFITAGCLTNLWEHEKPDLTLITLLVLDECHHAREGAHNFVDTSKKFRDFAPQCQILGLSASPVSGSVQESVLDARKQELLDNMGNAIVVEPNISAEELQVIKEEIVLKQNTEDDIVLCELKKLADDLLKVASQYEENSQPPSLKNGEFGAAVITWAQDEEALAIANGKPAAAVTCFVAIAHVVNVLLLVDTLGAICARDLLAVSLASFGRSSSSVSEEENQVLSMLVNMLQTTIAPRVGPNFQCVRFAQLLELLNGKTKMKTLVRVKTKAAVYWLARELRNSGIQAAGLVGDMSESTSRGTLDRFKLENSNLHVLVATSLVEEGVDLKQCDLVISYGVDGVLNSGKSVIQNAGRARMQNARFVVICKDERDLLRVRNMQRQVEAMKESMKKHLQV